MPSGSPSFDAQCRRCPRLAAFLDRVRREHPGYHAAPVPPFGDRRARLLVVGLAPGMHGANRTGRPFTGDHAGILLYDTLHRYGFANAPESRARDDRLRLIDCTISNAVKCLPPANKPTGAEVRECNRYLRGELDRLAPPVIVALGRVAHDAVLRAFDLPARTHRFGHAAEHPLTPASTLLDSYHCSRYNTQTRRLTAQMFGSVFARARALLDA